MLDIDIAFNLKDLIANWSNPTFKKFQKIISVTPNPPGLLYWRGPVRIIWGSCMIETIIGTFLKPDGWMR